MKLGRKILWLFLLLIVGATAAGIVLMIRGSEGNLNWKTRSGFEETKEVGSTVVVSGGSSKGKTTSLSVQTEQGAEQTQKEQEVLPGTVPRPEIDEQLLTKNKWSRPGTKTKGIKYLVIHYLGNPRTTAQENRDYFESLKDLKNVSMSSNYIVGLDGEIIQCVPDDEVAYASNHANKKSISIENCNIDSTGRFLKDTYISLVKLTAYLAEEYNLDRDHVIRHHDVTGKDCPLFYVENEEAWEIFLDDVFLYIALCHQNSPDLDHLEDVLGGLEFTYESRDDKSIVSAEADKKEETGRPHDFEDANDDSYLEEFHEGEEEEAPEEHYDDSYSHDYSDGAYEEEGNYGEEGSYDEEGAYEEGTYEESYQEDIPSPPASEDPPIPEQQPEDSGDYTPDDGGSNEMGEEYIEIPMEEEFVFGDMLYDSGAPSASE